jgi:peptidoglycan/LPS O-acetylase OafA/YrhL
MPSTEVVAFVAVIAAVILGFISLIRLIGLWIVHRTIRNAVDRNPEMVEPMLAQVFAPKGSDGDQRLSVILLAVGIAMIAASVIIGASWMHYAVAAACFPLIVGTALWLRLILNDRARRRAGKQ